MANIFSKLLSAGEGKEIKAFRNRVGEINYLEDEISQLSDEELREKTVEFRERYADGESLEDLLPEAFAVVREASGAHAGPAPLRRATHRWHGPQPRVRLPR